MNRNYRPAEWQKNPQNVKASHVQFWRNGIMLTAQMNTQDARDMVSNSRAFVICDQAIGALDEQGYSNS